jgi:hypothetical protein
MSDELTKKQREAGWTPELEADYVRQRNEAAANRIFNMVNGAINPLTGRPSRQTKIESGPGIHGWARQGWNGHAPWRNRRANPYSDD